MVEGGRVEEVADARTGGGAEEGEADAEDAEGEEAADEGDDGRDRAEEGAVGDVLRRWGEGGEELNKNESPDKIT